MTNIEWFHLVEMFTVGTSIDIESRLAVLGVGVGRGMMMFRRWLLVGMRAPFGGNGSVLELVIIAQYCEILKNPKLYRIQGKFYGCMLYLHLKQRKTER